MTWFRKAAKWATIAAAIFVVVMTLLSQRPNAGRNDFAIVIDRPPSEVFVWLVEPYHLTRWIDGLESSTPISGDSAVRGSKSRDVIRVGGKRYMVITQITDIRRDTLLIVQISSDPKGFTVNAMYELSPTSSGTRLHYAGQADYAGVFARMIEPLVTPQSQKKVEADMKHLKALIEAQPGARGI